MQQIFDGNAMKMMLIDELPKEQNQSKMHVNVHD
jgi:hypothetical protein